MSQPTSGDDRPSFDKPNEPSQPSYGQAPPPQQGYGQQPTSGQQPGYGQAPPPQQGYGAQEMSPSDQRTWAMLAHAGGILFGLLAPLVIFLVQKDKGAFVANQSKEALNFQITLTIAYVVGGLLSVIIIGFVVIVVAAVAHLVLCILAAVASNKGENYRYPFALRLVK